MAGFYTAAALAAGSSERVQLQPGERAYFLSVLGEPVGGVAGSIAFWNRTVTIPAGTAFTMGGADWPPDCEFYAKGQLFTFAGGLGPITFLWGPVLRGFNLERGNEWGGNAIR